MALNAGLLGGLLNLLFGNDRNAIVETVEVFRSNAERNAARDAQRAQAALRQFAAEFAGPRASLFDRTIDALNRIPRPAMALGTLGLFVAAMVDPIWFAARMQGIALVPEPLWWLLGAVVSFYFGARHQAKSQQFQRSIAETLARAPDVTAGIGALHALQAGAGRPEMAEAPDSPGAPAPATAAVVAPNPALADWRTSHARD